MDEITELTDSSVFKLQRGELFPRKNQRHKDLLQGVFIDYSPDLIVITRNGYTILDLLGDVGGVQGIFISAMSALLSLWNRNAIENYLVSKTFSGFGLNGEASNNDSQAPLHVN